MAEDDGVGASGGKVESKAGRGERRERRREIKEEGEEELERNVGRCGAGELWHA